MDLQLIKNLDTLVCDTCLGLIVDGAGNIAPDTSSTVNPQAICANSYLFGNSDDGLKDSKLPHLQMNPLIASSSAKQAKKSSFPLEFCC
jgi:hypothetical protein